MKANSYDWAFQYNKTCVLFFHIWWFHKIAQVWKNLLSSNLLSAIGTKGSFSTCGIAVTPCITALSSRLNFCNFQLRGQAPQRRVVGCGCHGNGTPNPRFSWPSRLTTHPTAHPTLHSIFGCLSRAEKCSFGSYIGSITAMRKSNLLTVTYWKDLLLEPI